MKYCHLNSQEVFRASNVVFAEPTPKGSYLNFKINTADYRWLNLPESNALHYYLWLFVQSTYIYIYMTCVWSMVGHKNKLDSAFLLCYFKPTTLVNGQYMVTVR